MISNRLALSGYWIDDPSFHELRISITPPAPQAVLRLRFLSTLAGGDHSRCSRRPGCDCAASHWRRQVALLSVASVGAIRIDGGGLAFDFVNEGPGRCAPSRRSTGYLFELFAEGERIAGAAARTA